jgi:hypothetical protein
MRKTNIKYPWSYNRGKSTSKISDAKLQDIFSIGHKSGEMNIQNLEIKKNSRSQANVMTGTTFYKYSRNSQSNYMSKRTKTNQNNTTLNSGLSMANETVRDRFNPNFTVAMGGQPSFLQNYGQDSIISNGIRVAENPIQIYN